MKIVYSTFLFKTCHDDSVTCVKPEKTFKLYIDLMFGNFETLIN